MGKRGRTAVILLALVTGTSACATSEQWKEWKSHSTHFATDQHMVFSLKNQGKTPRVRRSDQQLAAGQAWWGDPVLVRPDQIFQN